MDLRFYFSLFMRRFHWFVLIVVLCGSLGVTLARIAPTVFRAEALLVVESEQIPGELAASTVQTKAQEQIQIIRQRIKTRDILLELANNFNLYQDRKTPMSADDIVRDMRSRINIAVETNAALARRREAQATLVRVSFEASSARQVALVTNQVVTLVLDEDVSMRTSLARQTLEFFEQEVDRLDKELAQKSAAILSFKESNLEALPDSLEFRRSQQAALQERLLGLGRDISVLTDRRERMMQLQEADQSLSQLPREDLSPEQSELRELQDERVRLLAILAPQNPKVKLLDTQIAALERLVSAQSGISQDQTNTSGTPLTSFDIQLADLDVQMQYLQQQQTQVQNDLNEMSASIEATPGNTIAIETLERDYEALRAQYDQAVVNRAKAVTGDTIEALSKGQRISVIEQATIPDRPVSPNRPLIAAAGLGGGMVLGLLFVIAIELLKGGIRRPADLMSGLGITAFATLPYIRTRQEIARRRLTLCGIFLVVFGGAAGGLWLADQYYLPVENIIENIALRLS